MAHPIAPRPAPFGAHTVYRLVRVFEEAASIYRRWDARQRTAEILDALSDRELNDVGMTRANRMGTRYSMLAARSL